MWETPGRRHLTWPSLGNTNLGQNCSSNLVSFLAFFSWCLFRTFRKGNTIPGPSDHLPLRPMQLGSKEPWLMARTKCKVGTEKAGGSSAESLGGIFSAGYPISVDIAAPRAFGSPKSGETKKPKAQSNISRTGLVAESCHGQIQGLPPPQ